MREPSSFRDDRGFVFWLDGRPYRHINSSAKTAYDKLMSSGLYDDLTGQKVLIRHTEVPAPAGHEDAYRVLRPDLVPFISYPYEWSFEALQDAALVTLDIQRQAITKGLTLRDASAYNLQLLSGRMTFIDTLSFDVYEAGTPWTAYRQFCQHFLAPLALMAHRSPDLLQLMQTNIDGVPPQLAARLLPARSKLRPGLSIHLVAQGRMQKQYEGQTKATAAKLSHAGMMGLLDSLERTVKSLHLPKGRTTWGDYYDQTNYAPTDFEAKRTAVRNMLGVVKPGTVIDLGSNNGEFSRIAAESAQLVISADIDPECVNANYQSVKASRDERIVPLLIDLASPSPGIGWGNVERASFMDRAKGDVVLALALIHHLAIAGNVPLGMIAELFAQMAPNLIIEFVPKGDSQVTRLLSTREDIFSLYTPQGFEAAFSKYYKIVQSTPLAGSKRSLYLMRVK